MDQSSQVMPGSAAAARAGERWLRPLGLSMLLALLIQFLAGMLVNFFVKVPDNHPGAHPAEYFTGVAQSDIWALGFGEWELRLHVVIGLALAVISVALLVMAIVARNRAWIIAASFGFVGVFAAGFNGGSFLNYAEDVSSLLMTIGFLMALIAYALGMYETKPAS